MNTSSPKLGRIPLGKRTAVFYEAAHGKNDHLHD